MSATSHTPGPWRISAAKATKTRGIDILSGHAAFVAHVPVPPSYMTDHPEQANARLIAAAPDLLEVAERWAALDGGAWNVERHAREKAELLSVTRAAIAKATGEA